MRSSTKFAGAIAEAATHTDHGVVDASAESYLGEGGSAPRNPPENQAKAQAQAEAAFASVAEKIRSEHGLALIYKKPRVGRQRTSAEYSFWKRPIMSFIELPETLDLQPTALARRFGPSEHNFKVTKDTFRAPLSAPARKEARRLLKDRGCTLRLPTVFSIRDVQKAMKDRRDRSAGVRRYNPKVEVVGDTVYCDGKSYKMQSTGSDKRRIRAGGGWLPLDALLAFLSNQSQNEGG